MSDEPTPNSIRCPEYYPGGPNVRCIFTAGHRSQHGYCDYETGKSWVWGPVNLEMTEEERETFYKEIRSMSSTQSTEDIIRDLTLSGRTYYTSPLTIQENGPPTVQIAPEGWISIMRLGQVFLTNMILQEDRLLERTALKMLRWFLKVAQRGIEDNWGLGK